MATDDSYEIMPYKEIVELKKQIAELQRKTGDTSSQELLNSMAALTKSMNNMLQLFSSAAEEMKLEEKTESELSGRIAPLIEKVDKLDSQSQTIAEGLVAVAGMVKDIRREGEFGRIKPRPSEQPMFKPSKGPDFPPLEPSKGPDFPPLQPPMPTKGPMPPGAHPFPSHTSPRVVARKPMPPPGALPLGRAPPGMPPPGMAPPPGMGPGPMPPPGMAPPGDFGSLPPLPPLGEEPEKKKGILDIFKKK